LSFQLTSSPLLSSSSVTFRYAAAANSYERVLRIRPDDPHVQFQRAWCLLEAPGRRIDGITGFQTLLKQSPSAGGYYLLARGLQKESRHDEAVEAFREAVRLEGSGTADLYHNYAVSLEALRRFEEAVDVYPIVPKHDSGARVRGRGRERAHAGQRRLGVPQFCQTEIENLHAAVVGHDDVLRLEVAVDDSVLVRGGQAVGDLDSELDGLAEGYRTSAQGFANRRREGL
jgi:tetratricopeptide (TPR) repeat protein